MAKDTIIDEELAMEQKQKWGLKNTPPADPPQEDEPSDAKDAGGNAGQPDSSRHDSDGKGDKPRRRSKFKELVGGMVSGSILSRDEVKSQFLYMFFLAVLILFYINNIFSMHKLHQRRDALTREVKELRSKSVSLSAKLTEATRQSAIIEELERRGIELDEAVVPPVVIKDEK